VASVRAMVFLKSDQGGPLPSGHDTTANLDDRNLCRDHRNDGRIVGGLGGGGGDSSRFRSVAGLAKGAGFVELRTRQERSIGRRRPTPKSAPLNAGALVDCLRAGPWREP
jgi:hypothetical protein